MSARHLNLSITGSKPCKVLAFLVLADLYNMTTVPLQLAVFSHWYGLPVHLMFIIWTEWIYSEHSSLPYIQYYATLWQLSPIVLLSIITMLLIKVVDFTSMDVTSHPTLATLPPPHPQSLTSSRWIDMKTTAKSKILKHLNRLILNCKQRQCCADGTMMHRHKKEKQNISQCTITK